MSSVAPIVEPLGDLPLSDVNENQGKRSNGRLVGTRTPDLHRVKVAL
jgi:hypothetical protein